ncbi:MAG: class I SAM-dependent methyltransferase [Caulobacterales bacterium]|nr:class I SAM-dependent methyltransferase [Caulobacterales bacterium]
MKNTKISFPLLLADDWQDYELIDSGHGLKLERFGPYRFIRPDSQAYWHPKTDPNDWQADAIFAGRDGEEMGRWSFKSKVPEMWPMEWNDIKFYARCTPFRHLGLFPEQSVHWSWCVNLIKKSKSQPKILNLFGYTGLASLACAKAGAHVTHIDASKKAIAYGRENQSLCQLDDAPIRWIVEDALKFVEREIRRGNKYDGIILDPPKHGRGPNGEVFKLEESMYELLSNCSKLLSDDALFMVATVYAVRLSFVALQNTFQDAIGAKNGNIEAGEMALYNKKQNRALPTAIFARWSNSN